MASALTQTTPTRVIRVKTPSPQKFIQDVMKTSPPPPVMVTSVDHIVSPPQKIAFRTRLSFDFSLVENEIPRIASKAERDEILAHFPMATSIMLSVYVRITFAKEDLPKKPWPNSVAGLPLILDTNDSSDSFSPFTKGISGGGSRLEITTVPELWAMPTRETFAAIATALQDDFNLRVKKIRWFGGCWIVTPENASFDPQALPSRFGRSIIRYDTTEEDNFREFALRQKTPNDQISDDTMYANKLRPGVMISSGPFTGPELFTSSGLPVLCPNGSKRITVASRGFSKVGASVYHPDGRGTKIGVVESVLWDSDISLVKLDQDISYSREPFSSEIGLAPSLRTIKTPERLRTFDPVYFDSPFSGSHEGLLVGVEALRIPSDVAANELDWVMMNIMYFGNQNPHVGDGTCGSVIWDDEHDAIAVFRFIEKKDGLVYAVSLCDMERLGYTITDIP